MGIEVDITVIGGAVFPSVKHESRVLMAKEGIEGIVMMLELWEWHKR